MSDLPPLTELLANRKENAETEFKRLMEKLLTLQSQLQGTKFETDPLYRDIGINGVINGEFFGVTSPAAFYFKWVTEPLSKSIGKERLQQIMERLMEKKFKSFILVTPRRLNPQERKWLTDLTSGYKIEFYHYGHTRILELLEDYPALYKFYYGDYIEESSQNFYALNKDYREAVTKEIKNLEFIGLPTGQYQKQELLKETELKEVYIPLEFIKQKNSQQQFPLQEIAKESNRFVILGDPGTGKSTLAKYLALIYCMETPGKSEFPGNSKTPFIIPIRNFVQVQQSKTESINFFGYLKHIMEDNYRFDDVDEDFFTALLELGEAIVLFDGLDEITSEASRIRVARQIERFCNRYKDSPIWITSRITGYSDNVKFDSKNFFHYYLAPVSQHQVNDFIRKWYEIQIPIHKDRRKERIGSLQKAIRENPGVHRLKSNPLLLTMMTLVHQFEGTLPDDRAKLYEKCVELLLKTWQDQKYSTLGLRNPMEERGLKYNEQLRLLAAAAFYIQDKNQSVEDEGARGLIEEKQLEEVLFRARYDPRRMSPDTAREDIKTFLDYIRDRAGLFVEKGRNNKGENMFAFVHLSFLEYLCSYQIAEDKSKSQMQHIYRLIQYFGVPAWEEIVLLCLYIFSRSTSRANFVDEFYRATSAKLEKKENPHGWLILGKAVRDNIDFAIPDMRKIIKKVMKYWMKNDDLQDQAFSILKEITIFSMNGKDIIEKIIKRIICVRPADISFNFLYLYHRFFKIDEEILNCIEDNKEKLNLYPYLPIFSDSDAMSKYVNRSLKEEHWCIFYNSVSDRVNENLDKILKKQCSEHELRGYILSSWSEIYLEFRERDSFFNSSQQLQGNEVKIGNTRFEFGSHAVINYPLNLFEPIIEPHQIPKSLKITNKMLDIHDKSVTYTAEYKWISLWIFRVLEFELKNKLRLNKFDDIAKNDLVERLKNFSQHLGKYFCKDLNRDFSGYVNDNFIKDSNQFMEVYFKRNFQGGFRRYLTKYFSNDFSRYLSRDFTQEMSQILCKYFNKFFVGEFALDFCINLIQGINLDSSKDKDVIQHLRQHVKRQLDMDFKDFISKLYLKKYKTEINWDGYSSQELKKIYHLFVDEFFQENPQFVDQFYNYLYDYLFDRNFNVHFGVFSPSKRNPSNGVKTNILEPYLTITNPFMIPYIFNFIFIAALNHYVINLLARLRSKYPGESKDKNVELEEIIMSYIARNPFIAYIINKSWNFYCGYFIKQGYLNREDNILSRLALAAFVVNAAKVSLVAGVPCEGEKWGKILAEAEKSNDPFVQISLTFYKLCNFQDKEKNAHLLVQQLENFKKDYPAYYKLIGFTS